jgi:hypothetical protein
MATYYLSACHDCKEQVMWDKCPREQGEEWHKEYTEAFQRTRGIIRNLILITMMNFTIRFLGIWIWVFVIWMK